MDRVDLFRLLALLLPVAIPLYAWRVRGRNFAWFGAGVLLLSLPGGVVTHARLTGRLSPELAAWLDAAFLYSILAAAVHLTHLVQPRLRGRGFRALVSIPGQVFVAGGFLAGVWQLALLPLRGLLALLDAPALAGAWWLDALPLLLAVLSVATSLRAAPEWVRIPLGAGGPGELARVPVARSRREPARAPRSLRVVQITDPHLGPWQSVARLRRRIASLLEHEPDLVLLTGDFLTMEARGTPGALAEALAPLRDTAAPCFAVFGNHDHEARDEVRHGLARCGVRLLVDEAACVTTPAGPVQILGADYVGRGRRAHLRGLLERFPRRPDHLRLLLLHDPRGFRHLPAGEVELTLSGHTHGGQVGLVSLGLDWTVLSRSGWPDHGLFALGSNRLYVHRGTGFYGFPLRVGVPGEHSVLELILPGAGSGSGLASPLR